MSAGGRGSKPPSGGQSAGANYVSPSKNMSTMSTRALQEELFTRNRKRRFAILEGVRDREKQQPLRKADFTGLQKKKKSFLAESEFIDEEQSGQEIGTPRRMEDEDEVTVLTI